MSKRLESNFEVFGMAEISPTWPVRLRRMGLRRLLSVLFSVFIVHSLYVFLFQELLEPEFEGSQKTRDYLKAKCASLRTPAGPPASFKVASRLEKGSDRWVPGTPPILLRNARIWTGARNGTEVVYGDLLLDYGLIVAVGYIPPRLLENEKVVIRDVGGKWVTPGLVDLHSHIGVHSAPSLRGASDVNSRKSPILPWLRSIDGLNTHDASYELARSGGVTTAQILPGSANNIGGQAFVIKLRDTQERSSTSKILEPPSSLTHSVNQTGYVHWRHMKHACGENPDRLYGQSRMDAQWNFREAYNEARKLRDAQDSFCSKVEADSWKALNNENVHDLPENLLWESLVEVLRGRVKLSIHCYEAVDLDGIVRLSNEFKFPVASFHHAGETYLVPDLLKKTWGGTPSVALFASNFRKKREAYRGSEFAPRILSKHGIPVVMKSDHPVVNSRYLLFEAQQAHYYGLDPALALTSVTSVPARAAGLSHRIGTISEGYDADVVIWDSHPLALGATPQQVYIDGIAQLTDPNTLEKPETFQNLPKVPNWDKETNDTVNYDGLPPLHGWGMGKGGRFKIEGVRSMVIHEDETEDDTESLKTVFDDRDVLSTGAGRIVIIDDGRIICVQSPHESCATTFDTSMEVINLRGGSLAPGLTTYGAPLGLVEIRLESSTNDGIVLDPLTADLPDFLKSAHDGGVIRAVDGLSFEGRNALLAYRSGVTTAISFPVATGFIKGLSTAFSVGAPNSLVNGSIQLEEVAMHIAMSFALDVSVSTQIAVLRHLLFVDDSKPSLLHLDKEADVWARVREGIIPLVVSVEGADVMATLINLKAEFEAETGRKLKLTFSGATEAHILAKEIAEADISVVLTSPRPFPMLWEQKRILPGPPLSQDSSISALLRAGVNVAIGSVEESSTRNTRFELAWAALESNGTLSQHETIALATTNLHKALGFTQPRRRLGIPDIVMYANGGLLDFESKVVGVVSAERGIVEVF